MIIGSPACIVWQRNGGHLSEIEFLFEMKSGACVGRPTNWWFPEDASRTAKENSRNAKAICRECSVVEKCLEFSLRHETHGIWGGLSETEREQKRRQYGIQLSDTALVGMSSTARRAQRNMRRKNING